MTQLALDWSAPPVLAPSRGRTERSRETSRSGARSQTVRVWGEKTSALLQVLRNGGPMTRNELWAILRWPSISSVCSILDAAIRSGEVVSAGDYDVQTWPNGRQTKRERFRVRNRPFA